jgi:glycosyltransferase involved in cell wall biosynthesis
MAQCPKISIVTPSFNQGKYLERTIRSVLEQEYPNLEYIVIDGGSTDESVEIIKKYADRLTYWVSEPDRGQSHAINKGFDRATGEIFGWLNSDDWYHPEALQAVADAIAANPDAGAVVGAGEMVDEEGRIVLHIDPLEITLESLYQWMDSFFWQPSCFFRRNVWADCGPLNESIHFAMDLDLWLSIAKKYSFVRISTSLSSSLRHNEAKTTASGTLALADAISVIIKHGGFSEGRKYINKAFAERERQLAEYRDHMIEVTATLRSANEKIIKLEFELSDKLQMIMALENSITAFKNSLSWKITRPLREVAEFLNRLKADNGN